MPEVVVESVGASGTTLRASVSPSRGLRRFFDEDLWIEYSRDVGSVPPSVLTVPVLAQVCPVAWTRNADVVVPTVDAAFAESLTRVGAALRRMYPEFIRGGDLVVTDRLVENGSEANVSHDGPAGAGDPGHGERPTAEDRADGRTPATDGGAGASTGPPDHAGGGGATDPGEGGASAPGTGRTAQLFTGGVDSMATYLRHRAQSPALVSINGWTDPLDDEVWDRRVAALRRYSERFDVDHHFVRSNVLSFLDTAMLLSHFKRHVTGGWYSAVGSGLGLLGLCAPLAYAEGFDTVHVAASKSEAYDAPWGSHPDVDDQVRFAGTTANHDGFGLTRQEKVDLIADYADDAWPDLPLLTCDDVVSGNCGRCEKCCRTAVELVVAGRDPRRHGYDFGPGDFGYVRRQLEAGSWDIRSPWYHWSDLAARADPDREYPLDGAGPFLVWLDSVDVEALAERTGPPAHHRLLRAVARNTPYAAYRPLYAAYTRIRDAAGARDR